MKENIKGMLHYIRQAFGVSLVLMLVADCFFRFYFPAFLRTLFPHQAEGSLIEINGKAVAARECRTGIYRRLLFVEPTVCLPLQCIHRKCGRNSNLSGRIGIFRNWFGSNNYAPSNPELVERVEADMALFLEKNPDVKPEDIPTDLLTASGSGLDPHISPKAAEIQIPRIVAASGLEEDQVRKIIENHTTSKLLGVFGEETVNVVKVNIELGTAMGLLQN